MSVGNVFRTKREDLILTVFIISILLIVASSFIYFAENAVQPAAFSSIPQSMWWGMATLTTVGYGDVYPITPIGKILGAIVSLLGIGMFALPTGILSSGFTEEIQKRRNGPQICPHCGKAIKPWSDECRQFLCKQLGIFVVNTSVSQDRHHEGTRRER